MAQQFGLPQRLVIAVERPNDGRDLAAIAKADEGRDDLLAVRLIGRHVDDNFALPQHHDPVADGEQVIQILSC